MEKPFAAYEGDEPYVFVCYAHDDSSLVYPEIKWLQDQDINVWYDEGISPGAEFPDELGRAILGASLILFYVSPASIASRHCRDEVYFGLDRNTPILALHLSKSEMPAGLALTTGTSQAILRYEMRVPVYRQKLLDSIARLSEFSANSITISGDYPLSDRLALIKRLVVPLVSTTVVGIVVLGYVGMRYLDRQADIRWVRDEAIPQIERLMEDRWKDFTDPYAIAVEAEKILPDDPDLAEIFAKTSLLINVDTDPQGAEVYIKNYRKIEENWQHLGSTPIHNVRLPVGVFRWKVEKDGYDLVRAAHSTWDLSLSGDELLIPNDFARKLDRLEDIPNGMVRVAGAQTPLGKVADFFIDRNEITNAEFQKFIDIGGYRNPAYWQHEFVEYGQALTWEEGINGFVDRSGRPGPSTWLGGTYPDGKANHPVSGVSWYEAAAYAEFVGRSLPSGTHWGLARGDDSTLIQYPQLGGLAIFTPYSNFGRSGTVAVGSLPGYTAFGANDLAGNVREWCYNLTSQGRLVRGGSYDDNPYRFAELAQAPPMFRKDGYGFRTISLPDGNRLPESVFAEAPINPLRSSNWEEFVSDEVYDVFLRQFDYDQTPLNIHLESRDETSELWILERFSIDTAYGERMIVNLFLPTNAEPPYQTVVYFPGSGSLFQGSSENIDLYYEYPVFLSFLVKTGRAVVYPVYQGTFERSDELLIPLHMGSSTNTYTEYLVQLVQDFRRSMDYLETRVDIDKEKIAYYGMSWGGLLGGIIPAVEKRIDNAVVLAGGLSTAGRPESRSQHYAPHITVPFLMLVGRYDSILGYEASAKPLFDLVGTVPEHKVMKVYDTDHIPPKREFVTEILSWLDRYFGPVTVTAP